MQGVHIIAQPVHEGLVWECLTDQFPVRLPLRDLHGLFYEPLALVIEATQTLNEEQGLTLEGQLSFPLFIDFVRISTEENESVFTFVHTVDEFSLMFVLLTDMDRIFDHC